MTNERSATAESRSALALPLRAMKVSQEGGGWDFGWCVIDATDRIIAPYMTEAQAKQLAEPFTPSVRSEMAQPTPGLIEACQGLIRYWTRNLRNFQWEKADDHVKRINIALGEATNTEPAPLSAIEPPKMPSAHDHGNCELCDHIEAELQQERDIRADREAVLQDIAESLDIAPEPHQTYWERLMQAAKDALPPSLAHLSSSAEPVAWLRVEKRKNGKLTTYLDGDWHRNLPVGEWPLYKAPVSAIATTGTVEPHPAWDHLIHLVKNAPPNWGNRIGPWKDIDDWVHSLVSTVRSMRPMDRTSAGT